MLSFRKWLKKYMDLEFENVMALSDEEYYELEDMWHKYIEEDLKAKDKWQDKEILV